MNRLLVLTLLSAGILFSLTLVERGFTYDETLYLSIGRNLSDNPADYTMNGKYMLYRPPVLPYLIAGSSLITRGFSEPVSMFITPVFSLLLILSFYYGITHYYSERTAFFSALFLLLCPLYVRHSIRVLNHIEFALFFFLAVLAFRTGIEKSKMYWFCLSGIVGGLAFLTRYTGLMYFAVIGIYVLLEKRLHFYREKGVYIAFLFFFIPVIPWAFFSGEVYNGYFEFARIAMAALPRDSVTHTLQYIGVTILELTPFLVFFTLLGARTLKKDTFFLSYFGGALLTLILLQHREPRFILDFLPALALPAGAYVSSIYKKRKHIIYIVLFLMLLQTIGESIYASRFELHIKEAGLFIAESPLKGDIIANEEAQMYYYTERTVYFFPSTINEYESLLRNDVAFIVINQCSPPPFINEVLQGSQWKTAFVSEKGCGVIIYNVKKPLFYLL